MGQIDRAGTFRGNMVSQAVGISKGGHVQLEVNLNATEYFDPETKQWLDWSQYEETELHGYLYLVSKDSEPFKSAEQLKKALGWSGDTFDELDGTDYSGIVIQFRVKMEAYNNKMQTKLDWIDHADAQPGVTMQKLDKAGIKSLDAKFAKALKALGGGAKPKAVPEGKPAVPADKPKRGRPPAVKDKPDDKPKSGPAPFDLDKEPIEQTAPIAACADADAAWDQIAAAVDPSVPPAHIEETWLKVVEDLGGPDAVVEDNNWAGVRDIVLETLKV